MSVPNDAPQPSFPPSGEEPDCGHHSWAGLMELLDEHWPADIFPTRFEDDPKRDAGPRIVSLMRWVDQLQAKVRAVEVLHHPIPGEDVGPEGPYARQICDDCDEYWPCATSRALAGGIVPDASLIRWGDQQWAAMERVRTIHKPTKPVWANAAKKPEMRCCPTCYDETVSDEDNTWPCPTIRALGGDA